MRLLFGTLILLGLFSAAALWQRSWTTGARSNQGALSGSPTGGAQAAEGDGWSRVILGRPSGGEPYVERTEDVFARQQPEGNGEAPGAARLDGAHVVAPEAELPPARPPEPAKEVEVTIRAGQTLSEICRDRYGSSRLELVLAVARYNRLAGPDEIREGQRILLPAMEALPPPR